MRIGIDCSQVSGARTGIGNYTYNLVHALAGIDRENHYLLYPFFYFITNLDYRNAELPVAENFKTAFTKIPLPAMLLKALWTFATPDSFKERMLGDVDVVHSTTFCAPRFSNRKKRLVVTIYDLTVITHPECHEEANIRHCTRGIKDALENADEIIAISEHTKQDLVDYMNAPEEMITVTQLAADPAYGPVDEQGQLASVRQKYKLPENYILFVGSLEPRKNIKTLVDAYAKLKKPLRRACPLVIAGAKGWLNSGVFRAVNELGIADDVHFIGYIGHADISAVYSMATVFVYPSLYEGFGLPILEAMACGAPVITSNTSSMPEVAGDAAVLVTPTDVEETAEAIERIIGDDTLQISLRAKGLKRAAMFSWERCAKETLEVYKRAAGRV